MLPRARQRRGHAGYERRLTVEILEPRWLLSLTNAAIDADQENILVGGVGGLAAWADLLDEHDLASRLLPVVGQATGQALDLGDILEQGLADRISDYFTADSDPTTDELVMAIQGLNATSFDNVMLSVMNVTGGKSTVPGTNELIFNLEFGAARSLMTNPSLGPQGEALGIDFSSQIAVGADLTFNFSFGVDLASGLSDEEAFFIRNVDLDAEIDANVASLATGPMSIGFFGAVVASGNLMIDAQLGVSLANPDADPAGNITLAELQDTSLASLVSLTGGGSASGSISATLGSLGTFLPIGTPTISFSSSNPFDAPNLSFNAAFDQVRSFTNISSISFLGVLEQLGTFLEGVAGSSVLDERLQLVSQSRIGDLIDLGGILRKGLAEELVDVDGVPTFATVQELAADLAAVLGLPAGTIDADYVPASQELTFHLIIDHTFASVDAPFGISLDLSPVGGLTGSGEVAVDADGSLGFTIGIDLSDPSAVMVATTAAPADGKISADANFELTLGLGAPVAVTLAQSATSSNTNRSDLVADLTAALAAAGLSGSVVAALDGSNRLTLATTTSALGITALELQAADYDPDGPPSSDPIVTELGFRERHFAFDSLANHAFLEDASLTGSVSVSASNIDAAAKVGFLKVGVVDGTGNAQASFSLEIKDPATQTPGGRVGLFELVSALATDITDVIDAPTLAGSLAISLPLQATIFGVPVGGSPELTVSWPDLTTGDPEVTLTDGDELLSFEHLSGLDFTSALVYLGNYLASLEDFSFFGLEIPAISKSLGDLAGYADRFLEFAAAFEQDAPATLDELEVSLEGAFGLAPNELDLSLAENGDVIRVDLTLAEQYIRQFPLALKLPFTNGDGLEILETLVNLEASGALNVDFGVDFQLSFGIDISSAALPVPFLYESSHLNLEAQVKADDIDFQANIGPFGLFIKNGTFLIDADGDEMTNDHAVLAISLTDNNAITSDGKIYLDTIGLNNAEASLDGELELVLPLSFPFASDFVGNIELTIGDLGDIENTTTLTIPTIQQEEQQGEPAGLLDHLSSILNGLDTWFQIAIDAFNGKVAGVELPFVGKDLGKVADFLEKVRDDVISEITDRFNETEGDTAAALQTALFGAFGPDGLNILKDKNGSGTVTLEDVQYVSTDFDMDQKVDQVEFSMDLGQDFAILATPIDFDIGLPGLGLDVNGNLDVLVGYNWDLAFGLSNAQGFYLLTGQEDEIKIDFEVRIPDLRGRGELAFLQLDVADEDADANPNNDGIDVDMDSRKPSSFMAGLTIDILDPIDNPDDPNDTGRLQETEIKKLFLGELDVEDVLVIDLVGTADLNLDLMVSFQGDARFPSIGAEFNLDWMFGGEEPEEGEEELEGDKPTVEFTHVTLNAGDFISDFSGEVLKKIKKFTEPLQPVVEFLTSPVPILEDFGFDFTPLEIAKALGYATEVEYIEAVADLIAVSSGVPEVPGNLLIPMGSFKIVDQGGDAVDLRNNNALTGAMPQVTQSADPVMELKNADAEAGDFFDELKAMGIELPLLENPGSIFQLMMGQDVDLFLYDVPKLAIDFPFPIIKIGPLIPPIPLFASFSGNIGAAIDLAVGFDTHGLHVARETGDWYDVFSGFFISDTANPDGTGDDVPEARLYGSLNAGAEISLAIVSAGVSGGVAMNLTADLVDPNSDGRVHVDELQANIPLGVTGTFDLGGALTARLDAYVEFLFKRVNFNLAEIEIASFEFTDEDIFRDRFSGNNSMAAATFLGAGPGLHVDGLGLESTSDVDWYKFELLEQDSVDVDIRHSDVHGGIDLEVYNASGQKIAEGTSDKDRDVATLVDVPAGNYFVRVTGSAKLNNYQLAVEPGDTSSTRVIYVNPSGATDHSGSYYTYAAGSDTFEGLNHRKPKASLQNVLNTYDLGPNDIVVFDTGVYAPGGAITAADSGAIFVGSVGGSTLAGITLNDADSNRFHRLNILSSSPGISLLNSDNNVFQFVNFSGGGVNALLDKSDGNLFDQSTFAGSGDGLIILGLGGTDDCQDNIVRYSDFKNAQTSVAIFSQAPNLLDSNTFTGSGAIGIHLPPDVPATLVHNDISGRGKGILWESRIATVLDNDIFSSTVGIETIGGVVGPDNPTPFGAPGGQIPNRVFSNQTGILVSEGSAGAIVRHTEVYNNVVGIEAHGDQTQILANDVHGNDIGIRSDREVGPASWDANLHNLVHDNETGIVALAGAEVRFNRIYANDVGLQVLGLSDVHHNLIYRNSGDGVLVSGARGVALRNNTIFSPGQAGVHLAGFLSEVDVRNNIVMTTAGFGLVVEAASQFGYVSDYNDYYSTGGGGVAFQGKGFFDLYDWQVEAESDLHSLGTTVLDPTLDDPLFVNLAGDDYHVLSDSASIDAGDPLSDYSLEPLANGNRINLGAYGNTPQATTSPARRLEITAPNFYVDLIPSQTYDIRWETNNIGPGVDLDIDLIQVGVGKIADIATVSASAGMTTWTPGNFVAGNNTNRYRIRIATLSGPAEDDESREPFAIPVFNPADANTFYVNDGSTANNLYTSAVGNNRNTGLTSSTPKVVIRPLVLSYPMGPGDTVRVDTGDYVHAVNLNLSSTPLAFDPRMNTVSDTLITGPIGIIVPGLVARIDRANPNLGSAAIDMIDSPNMTVNDLTIVGAGIGVRARSGSESLNATRLILSDHGFDGLSIETASHDAELTQLTVFDNGRHGIFVDSRLIFLSQSVIHDNAEIGVALRSVGAASVTRNEVYNNFRGIDVINPGPDVATIGFDVVPPISLGNLVHHNLEDGIVAAGNVLVIGNTVNENGNIGIRLIDGADATRNVVRQHVTGISALGSTSDITENRSFINSNKGIVASHDSNVLRNVTYSNDVYGIHGDRFSGVIDHNLIYSTGYASMLVEGPGVGAQITHNTIYEPCDENDGVEVGPTTVETDWDPQVYLERVNPPPFVFPQVFPFTTPLWGNLKIEFQDAMGSLGGSFDLGPGGGTAALTSMPLPPGETWTIHYELVDMQLSSAMFPLTPVGVVEAKLATGPISKGHMVLDNVGGTLIGTNHLELWFEFNFPSLGTTLVPTSPVIIDYTINFSHGFTDFEALQIPTFIPTSSPPPGAMLIKQFSSEQWRWRMQFADVTHGDPDPPPQDRGDTCAEFGIIIRNLSERVLLRQNAVFVEGHALNPPGGPNSLDIFVAADSTLRWDSDTNAWIIEYGYVGEYAGTLAVDLTAWQSVTNDDFHSISPDVDDVWVDPDGNDNVLGAFNGNDDNFHEQSSFGQVTQGALAPIENPDLGINFGYPVFQAVTFQATGGGAADLSPLVDAAEPAASFALESTSIFLPIQHGQFANIGAYGNTAQASRSEPEFVHLVYPFGVEQIVYGRTYEIRWRSHDLLPSDLVTIELRHGGVAGPVEMVISPAAPNTGTFLWTVPFGIPPLPGSDYVIAITRPSVLTPPTIAGASPFLFSIGADTRRPVVLGTTPDIVELGTSTNADISSITVEFSEFVSGGFGSYQLKSAGTNGIFDDGDDVTYFLLPSTSGGLSAGDPVSVTLTILGGPLPEGDYRLTAFNAGITDFAGLNLDGTYSGSASDYVRFFTVDKTPPGVAITPVAPNPRNSGASPIGIMFTEAVVEPGLADVRLTLDGGPNLLSGTQALTSFDGVLWLLADTSGITSREGTYTLSLTAANSNIRDLAGNPLTLDASISWLVDTTPPTLDIVDVSPDPRNSATSQATLVFSEPVFNFALGNLHLFRDGTEIMLTGANAPTTSDNVTWTVSNLAGLTSAEGSYLLKVAVGGTLKDAAGNGLAAEVRETWQVMTTPPAADVVDVTPDLRVDSVAEIVVSFNVPVIGFDLSDLQLTRGGNNVSLVGLPVPTSLDQMNWHVTGLAPLTSANGDYVFSLVAAGSGIQDLAGNALAADASDAWVRDDVHPVVAITPVAPDPANASVDYVEFAFSKPVTGVELANLVLARNAMPIDWTDAQSVTTTDGVTWRVNNLTPLTATNGSYTLTLDPVANVIQAFPGNPLVVGDSEAWLIDVTGPTVTISGVTPNAAFDPTNSVEIVFSEPVSGFDKSELVLTRRGFVVPLTGAQTLTTVDNQTWMLSNLAPLTSVPGKYELSLRAAGSGIQDAATNSLQVGTFETWRVLIPGDLSADNRVGLKDLGRLGRNFGIAMPTPEQGDLNRDLTVNRPDLVTLLGVYGSSLPPNPVLDAFNGSGAATFSSLQAQHAAFLGTTDAAITFTGLSGVIAPNQFTVSHGVTFSNLGALGAVLEGDPGSVENLDGYDGSYQPNGNTVYVSYPNHLAPLTITFSSPVAAVGSFVATGVQGSPHTLTIIAFDTTGAILTTLTVPTQLFADAQNREGFWAVKADAAAISKITILNNNPVDFGNALILDNLAWRAVPAGSGSVVLGESNGAATSAFDLSADLPALTSEVHGLLPVDAAFDWMSTASRPLANTRTARRFDRVGDAGDVQTDEALLACLSERAWPRAADEQRASSADVRSELARDRAAADELFAELATSPSSAPFASRLHRFAKVSST